MVQFDNKGDGIGKYDIFQYQHISEGRYGYNKIGEWTDRFVFHSNILFFFYFC